MAVLKRLLQASALAALAMAPALVLAQVTGPVVTFGPLASASVPTLGEWSALGLSALVAVAALVALRKKQGSRMVMALALTAAGLMAATQGSGVMGSAWAGFSGYVISNPAGGAVTLQWGDGVQPVQNTSGVPLRVLSVTPDNVRDADSTTCKASLVLQPGETCNVETFVG